MFNNWEQNERILAMEEERRLSPPEPSRVGVCADCNDWLYADDEIFLDDGDLLCDMCYDTRAAQAKQRAKDAAVESLSEPPDDEDRRYDEYRDSQFDGGYADHGL